MRDLNEEDKALYKTVGYIVLFPVLLMLAMLLLVNCCFPHKNLPPDNIAEEIAEEVTEQFFKNTLDLDIEFDFSPYSGPESKPLVYSEKGLDTKGIQ